MWRLCAYCSVFKTIERMIAMKNSIVTFLTGLLMITLMGCSNPEKDVANSNNDAANQDRDVLYQVSLLTD